MALLTRMSGGLFLSLAVALAWAGSETVGNLGDPDQIQFVGNDTFASRQLRSALGCNLDVLLAGHPEAPLDELLRLLEQRIVEGYRHCGFQAATVTARHVDERAQIVVAINEGPRCRCGEIEVIGTHTIPVDRLRKLLESPPDLPHNGGNKETATSQTSSKPVWPTGDPTSFSPGHWKSLREPIQKLFQSLGYHDVRFIVSPRAETNGTATLVLTITDEGPRAVLGEIEVIGASKNSPADVIRFLDLPAGLLLDSEAKTRIELKLRDSARFITHEAEIITPPFGDAPSILRIKLLEYAESPKLTEEFSPEQSAMVRLTGWLNTFESTDNDFELQLHAPIDQKVDLKTEPPQGAMIGHVQMVISHRQQGCFFRIRLEEHQQRELFELWVHLTVKQAALFSPRHGLRYETTNVPLCVVGTAQWIAKPPDDEGRISAFNFGIGVRNDPYRKPPPFILQMSAAPVAAIREAHINRDSIRWQDGIMSINSPRGRVVVDATTGRLMEAHLQEGPQTRLAFTCQPGLYRKLAAEYERLNEGARVIRSDDAPISGLLSFLATVLPEPPSDNKSAALTALAHSVLKRGALSAFDRLLLDFFNKPKDQFVIPVEEDSYKKKPQAGWTAFILPIARGLVPNPSWPWTVCREFVFAESRRSARSERAIRTLLTDPETGPIASLTSACVFGLLNPPLKFAFAKQGSTRLKREHFRHDYEPFLRDDSPLGKLMLATAQTLQEFDDREIETLVSQLPLDDSERLGLSRVLRIFPARKSARAADALREALDEAWEPLIEPRVRNLLNTLAK